ncbi:MAG: cytochrome C biosynthesis protein [Bacteroidales bacterium]|nr:cytochrome C biosynthesis protein [Bacteroidales bacterium]
MKPKIKPIQILVAIIVIHISGCTTDNFENTQKLDRKPAIDPDYSGVTIPPNIAPMNFLIQEEGNFFRITVTSSSNDAQFSVTSSDGIVRLPLGAWKEMLGDSKGDKIKIQVAASEEDKDTLKQFQPIYMHVAKEPIDPYLSYRLLYPGYYSWSKMKIMQRSLEDFREESLIENQILEKNCANCHAFNQNNPDEFLVHIRGSKGGTYFMEDGKITRTALKTENMPGGATYPSWHPGGRYVAFSSNKVKQSFYAHPQKSIEVYDQVSALVLYDREENEMLYIREQDTTDHMQTFPSWSPDGQYLYFCRTRQVEENYSVQNVKDIHYDLARKPFDPETRTFGETEIVFDAGKRNKSVSFPRISPDGQYLVFTLHDYGTFPIWHKEADLYLLNLQSGNYKRMKLNSDETESYHTWSSNGRWLVFSSKRRDGRSARPYFAWFGSSGEIGKPFVLPQEDPTRYHNMLKTFNIPEFVKGKINFGPRDFARAADKQSLSAKAGNSVDSTQQWFEGKKEGSAETEWGIHE